MLLWCRLVLSCWFSFLFFIQLSRSLFLCLAGCKLHVQMPDCCSVHQVLLGWACNAAQPRCGLLMILIGHLSILSIKGQQPRVLQARQALKQYKEAGVSLSACSVASDGFGSWPVYDKQGRLLSYEVCFCQLRLHLSQCGRCCLHTICSLPQ